MHVSYNEPFSHSLYLKLPENLSIFGRKFALWRGVTAGQPGDKSIQNGLWSCPAGYFIPSTAASTENSHLGRASCRNLVSNFKPGGL
jgi:hypothetical protein